MFEIGNFVYGPNGRQPAHVPEQEYETKPGSKKRVMPNSFFSLGQPVPGSGHKSEADLREFGSATPGAFNADQDNEAIMEEDEFSDAEGH